MGGSGEQPRLGERLGVTEDGGEMAQAGAARKEKAARTGVTPALQG